MPYQETTNNILVTAHPEFMEEQSNIESQVYAFAYTITIENIGSATVQLLRRHWFVYSGGEPLTEVKGEGVVGEKPILEPGEKFEYTSGSVINEKVGSMKGSYTFTDQAGHTFEVQIPQFELIYPALIH